MRQIPFLALIGFAVLPSVAQAKESLEYIDLLGAEVVGELATQRYDESIDKKFVGTRDASVVAGCVRDGIKANRLYIFSHNPGQIAVKKRFEQMLEDFKVAP